ncbi:MAG: flagellar biosynthesis anti-sigma factor FlgM [Gammaproteobacteria bacterium]|nr:flagellar biosynthesis anti-sigma factor FlgM [Gammaproteobacteria bacterium]MBU2182800.1 flagellar biosynthesis anti-sigma factor FlgM [Gammaproteobacteria bacterium]MBU2205958.1 flagellar biosynthesis anti-sigma factor FlgM [Gammaproteobacteria bacterium]
MQIDPKNSLQVEPANRLQQKQHSTTAQPHSDTSSQPAPAASQVSSISQSLQQSYDSLAEHDGVDMNKVRQLQQAIANGELKLDEEALIHAMLDMHKK